MADNRRPRFLIVEDERDVAEKFSRALQPMGDSRIAERDAQVLAELHDFAPHAILLDIHLEGQDIDEPWVAGVRILEKIRALPPPLGTTPVIVITGRIEPEIEGQCRRLGVSAFFRKPVSVAKLRSAVEEALR
jgi:CheY-like chemotaxis protein